MKTLIATLKEMGMVSYAEVSLLWLKKDTTACSGCSDGEDSDAESIPPLFEPEDDLYDPLEEEPASQVEL